MTSPIISCAHCATKNRVPATVKGRPRCASCHRDLPWLVDAHDDDFDAIVATHLPVLVDLWAPWCGPCRMVAPAVEQAARELAGQLKVVKVDVDQAPRVAARFGVQGVPTLLLLRNGGVVDRHVGALGPGPLRAWLRDQMTRPAA
jgi:thioredoxin 2